MKSKILHFFAFFLFSSALARGEYRKPLKKAPEVHKIDFSRISSSYNSKEVLESIYQEALRGLDFEGIERVAHAANLPNFYIDETTQEKKFIEYTSRWKYLSPALAYKLKDDEEGQRELAKRLDAIAFHLYLRLPIKTLLPTRLAIVAAAPVCAGASLMTLGMGIANCFSGEGKWALYRFAQSSAGAAIAAWAGFEFLEMVMRDWYYGFKRGEQITRDWKLYKGIRLDLDAIPRGKMPCWYESSNGSHALVYDVS